MSEAQEAVGQPGGRGRLGLLESLRRPKLALAFCFGVATGMPVTMTGGALGFWLREENFALATIGFMSWIGLVIAFKWVWAPIVERVELPLLHKRFGRRRSWMLLGQVFVSVGLVGMSLIGPSANLTAFALFALVAAFASATQDIAVDAWRIEIADDHEQDMVAAAYVFGLRLGYFIGDVALLALSHFIGWSLAYLVMASSSIVGFIGALIAREPNVDRPSVRGGLVRAFLDAYVGPVRQFFLDHGRTAFFMLLLAALYFVPDQIMGPMVAPMYIDLGFRTDQIALVRTTFGITSTLIGVAVAGLIGTRYGTISAVTVGAILAALSNFGFAALALSGGPMWLWFSTAAFEGFSAGLANTALVTWAGRLTNLGYTAAQFALLSSLMQSVGNGLRGFSGVAVENLQAISGSQMMGYALYFSSTVFICIPTLILVWIVSRPRAAKQLA